MYPYTPTDIASHLGHSYWYYANKLIEQVALETGVNIKSFDNSYHIKMIAGNKYPTYKYSQAAVDLLQNVQAGQPYKLAKDCLPSYLSVKPVKRTRVMATSEVE